MTFKKPYLFLFFALNISVLTLFSQPTCDFSTDKSKGCAPVLVKFTNLSSANATSYSWSFGNAGTSTAKNPSFLFASPGIYNVTLTATNNQGSASKSFIVPIYAAPNVDFAANKTDICGFTPITFSDLSTPQSANINKWLWSFGDGLFSTEQHPVHQYAKEGKFSVYLQIEDDNQCANTYTLKDLITINQPAARFDADSFVCIVPAAIQFNNQSTGTQLKYKWNFGDGGTSTSESPKRYYNNYDTVQVSLVVQSEGSSCIDSINKTLRITNYKTNFDYTVQCNGQKDFSMNFTNKAVPVATSNIWDFGDGDTAMSINPAHKFAAKGNYNIRLISRYNKTCIDTSIQNYTSPTAQFSYPDLACKAPFTVNFINQSSGSQLTHQWIFSNGQNSTQTNPVQTFVVPPAKANVILTESNPWGCSHSDTSDIYFPVPVAGIRIDAPSSGCAPLGVTFKDESTSFGSPIVKWNWNFSDPSSGALNTSSLQNPAHNFINTGQYNISLTVENTKGCTHTKTLVKAVRTGEKPSSANFSTDADSVCFHSTHQYNDLTTYSHPTSQANYWCWAMYQNGNNLLDGNGHLPESCPDSGYYRSNSEWVAIPNPAINYEKWNSHTNTYKHDTLWAHSAQPVSGAFYVHMIVGNNGCYAEVKKPVFVKGNMAMPNYIFPSGEVSLGACKPPFTIGLYNGSYDWNKLNYFNVTKVGTNDTIAKIKSKDTTYVTITHSGTYDINISTTNSAEGCTDNAKRIIRVDSIIPQKSVPASVCTGVKAEMINFTKSTLGYMNNYMWDYGDLTTLGGPSADSTNKIYADTGRYILNISATAQVPYNYISTSVTTFKSCETTQRDTIYVQGLIAKFASTKNDFCVGELAPFVDSTNSTSAITNRLWRFGDNGIANTKQSNHRYSTTGTYNVQLVLQNSYGCKDSILKSNYINVSQPTANFSSTKNISCTGQSIKFINQSSPTAALTYKWKFGQTDSTTASSPTVTFNSAGLFDITLYAFNNKGCSDTIIKKKEINIANLPQVNFSADTLNANCSPFLVSFTDSSKSDIQSWEWDFGDGNTSNEKNAINNFTHPGKFDVSLRVRNGNGCYNTASKAKYIAVKGPYGEFALSTDSGCVPLNVRFDQNFSGTNFYVWYFGDGSSQNYNFALKKDSVYHNFAKRGLFASFVELIDSNNCSSKLIAQNIHAEKVESDFSISDSLLCHVGNEQFNNTSKSAFALTQRWNFGDNNFSSNESPLHAYTKQGKYDIKLVSNSSIGCSDSTTKKIKIYKAPSLKIDTFNNAFCVPFTMQLKAINIDPSVRIDQLFWQHNNSKKDSTFTAFAINSAGPQNFHLMVNYGETLCNIDSLIALQTYDAPRANFIITPEHPSVNSAVYFDDQSDNSTAWYWKIGDGSSSDKSHPVVNYDKKGEYTVTLYASNAGNCIDSISKSLTVSAENFVKIVSGFTPNGDGINDVVKILNAGEMKLVDFAIYNRWGQMIFQTSDLQQFWDGTYNGSLQSESTFVYYVKAINKKTSAEILEKGNITLIK